MSAFNGSKRWGLGVVLLVVFLRGSTVTVLSNRPGLLTLEIQIDSVWVDENGEVRTQPALSRYQVPGLPELPYVTEVLLEVPENAKVNVYQSQERQISGARVPVTGRESAKGIDLQRPLHSRVGSAFPGQVARIQKTVSLRGHEAVVLEVFPVRIVGEKLLWNQRLTVQLRWQPRGRRRAALLSKMDIKSLTSPTRSRSMSTLAAIPPYQFFPHIAKLGVDTVGWYVLTRNTMIDSGLNVGSVDPRTFRLWNQEEEIPLFVEGEEDGHFDPGDRLIFHGNPAPPPDGAPYRDNFYTAENVYWLTWGGEGGLRYLPESAYPGVDPGQVYLPADYRFTLHIETNDYFARLGSMGLHEPWDTFEHFFMEPPIQGGTQVTFPFTLASPKQEATATFDIAIRFQGMTTGNHAVQVFINGYLLLDGAWSGQTAYTLQSTNNASLLSTFLNDGLNTLSISLAGDPANPYDQVYLDWADLTYDRLYRAQDNELQFSVEGTFPVMTQFDISGFTSPDIWLFKDGLSRLTDYLVLSSAGAGTYRIVFQDLVNSDSTCYQAFTESRLKPVKSLSPVDPITTPLFVGGAPYLAMGPDSFRTAVSPLVLAHNGVFVDVDEVYREYSGGVISPYAIRDFLTDVYWNWQPRPSAVLLVQQGKWFGWEGSGGTTPHFLPAMKIQTVGFGAVASDYWYACVAGEDLLPEFSVGRLPARNVSELDQVVQKILAMNTFQANPWNNRILLIGGYESTFKDQSEVLLNTLVGSGFFPTRLYVDQYSEGGPFYGSTEDLVGYLNEGRIWVNFLGHGGGAVWGDRSLLTLDDLTDLSNTTSQPLVTSMTCFTGDVTNPNSLGRRMVLKEEGGATAWIGSAGVGWIINDFLLLQPFSDLLLTQREATVGSLLHAAKVLYLASNTVFPQIARSQVYQYNLIGDPALVVPFPEKTTIITDPSIVQPGGSFTVNPTNGSPPTITAQLFDEHNYPVPSEPLVIENGPPYTLTLPDTLAGAWYTVNTTYVLDQQVYQANDTVLTPMPIARILFTEPAQPTVRDSIDVFASLSDTAGVARVELWMRRYDVISQGWVELFVVEMEDQNGTFQPRHRLPPQTDYLEWELYCRVKDGMGRYYVGPRFPLHIHQLPNVRPRDLRFFVDKTIGLEASIDHNSVAFDPGIVTFQRQGPGGWEFVGKDTLQYASGSIVARVTNVFPRGSYTYRVVVSTPSPQAYVTDDTLVMRLETPAFWVTKALGTTEDLKTHASVGLSGVDIEVPGGVTDEDYILSLASVQKLSLRYQPHFTVVNLDSQRAGVQITSRVGVPYTVQWTVQNPIPDSLALYQYYTPVDLWLPVPQYTLESKSVHFQGSGDLQVAWLEVEDQEPPLLEAMLNGQHFLEASYINATPVLTVIANDQNGVDCRPEQVQFWVNGRLRNLTGIMKVSGRGNHLGIQLTPTLSPSDTSIQMVVADAAGNLSDTLNLTFRVWEEMALIDYGNFPNPFTDKTVFAYELTETVDRFSLKIYSLDGRLVWELGSGDMVTALDPRVGAYHEIVWDGRDHTGAFVSNGVYFYQMYAKKGKRVIKKQGKVAKAR